CLRKMPPCPCVRYARRAQRAQGHGQALDAVVHRMVVRKPRDGAREGAQIVEDTRGALDYERLCSRRAALADRRLEIEEKGIASPKNRRNALPPSSIRAGRHPR